MFAAISPYMGLGKSELPIFVKVSKLPLLAPKCQANESENWTPFSFQDEMEIF